MRASQQLRYAIYGLFDLAYNGGPRPVPLVEVGRRQAIPARYLEQIFQKLRRAGLVASKRGPGGGYQLARKPEAIHVADIIAAVQGAVLTLSEPETPPTSQCPEFLWPLLQDQLAQSLARFSLAELCREAQARGVPRAPAEPTSYEI